MIPPPYLRAKDTVGIISTARKISEEEITEAIHLLNSWELSSKIGQTIGIESNQYAGTDKERIADLQAMLDDPKIKAIWCARGGYGTVRLIDHLDFSKFSKHPKWLIGFSDVTVLHSHLHQLGIQTVHGTMPISLEDNTPAAINTLKNCLFGKETVIATEAIESNRKGASEGSLVGGNLSILYSLLGSPSSIETKGKILFLEDLDEYLYHMDRMIMNLKRNGYLKELAGLIVGGFTKMHDNSVPFGKNATEIILDAVKEYDYPVCFDFPAGHISDNRAMIFGRNHRLQVTEKGVRLNQI